MSNDFYSALQEVQQIPKLMRELLELFTVFINAKKNTLASAQTARVFNLEDASTHVTAETTLKNIEEVLRVLCGLAEIAMPAPEQERRFLFFSKVKAPTAQAMEPPRVATKPVSPPEHSKPKQ